MVEAAVNKKTSAMTNNQLLNESPVPNDKVEYVLNTQQLCRAHRSADVRVYEVGRTNFDRIF